MNDRGRALILFQGYVGQSGNSIVSMDTTDRVSPAGLPCPASIKNTLKPRPDIGHSADSPGLEVE